MIGCQGILPPSVPDGCRAIQIQCRASLPQSNGIHHLKVIAERGRAAWQKASGYRWRALVEADVNRFKRVIGDGLRSRTDRCRTTEMVIAVAALNCMLELGRPEYVRLV
jgi:hypothetical protein